MDGSKPARRNCVNRGEARDDGLDIEAGSAPEQLLDLRAFLGQVEQLLYRGHPQALGRDRLT